VVYNFLVFLGEEAESEFVFLFGAIRSLVFSNEVDEFDFSFSEGCGQEV